MFPYIFMLYILAINCIGFFAMGIDKRKARRRKRRISERTFFIIAIILGSVGVFAGMYAFRHKTRHTKFVVGIPVILAAQIILGIIINMKIS